ncbi:MAG: AI-2E family transporter [Patescibacteria group bacterium]|nr:AI-2E family transporter [Patescibacteria group bacterium]
MLFKNHSKEPREVNVTVSVETFAKLIVMVVATVVLLMAINRASHALILIFASFFLALALNAPVNWVSQHLPGKRRGSRALGTSLSFLIVVLLLGAFIASIVPPLVKQTGNFVTAAPHLVQDLKNEDSGAGKIVRHYHLEGQVNTVSRQVSERFKHVGGSAFSTFQTIGTSVFSLLTILVLTFMMLVEGPEIIAFFRELLPKKRRKLADQLSYDMYRVIKGYVNGQVTLAAIAAVLIFPALLILHISYPVALLVIIFICGLIPMVGHTIGAVIVTLVALSQSLSAAVIILIYYILYQQLENYLVQPRIQANSTNMSPLLVFISVVVGVSFGGLFGGLVAIPVTGCIRIAILEYLRSQNIIDAPDVEKTIKEATT